MNTQIRNLAAITMIASLLGCATVDFEHPKETSVALQPTATADTYLGQQLNDLADTHPAGESGFLPIGDGIEALSAQE